MTKYVRSHHRPCRVCGSPAATPFGIYCNRHASRNRRHGHPEQPTITQAQLKPFHRVVVRYRRVNKGLKWDAINARWDAIVAVAKGIVADYRAGKVGIRPQRQAAETVLTLAANVPVERIVDNVIAMYLMEAFDPRMFRSDDGFRAELARVLRKLTPANAKHWTKPETGVTKRAYVELSRRAKDYLADWIATALGPVGVRVAQLEAERIKGEQDAKDSFRAALAEMTS